MRKREWFLSGTRRSTLPAGCSPHSAGPVSSVQIRQPLCRAVTRPFVRGRRTDSNATTLRLSLTFKVRRIYPTNWVRQDEKTIGCATEADASVGFGEPAAAATTRWTPRGSLPTKGLAEIDDEMSKTIAGGQPPT